MMLMPLAGLALAAHVWAAPVAARVRHELPDNRATLVLREGTHVSMTLYLNYTDALQRVLAPHRTLQEFVLTWSAMPLPQLRADLRRAQEHLESGTRLVRAPGTALPLTNWIWPDAIRVQALLQQQAMQAVVAPADHAHEAPTEVRAEAVAAQPIQSLTARFPIEYQRVLVVSYKPNQVWVDPAAPSPRIVF